MNYTVKLNKHALRDYNKLDGSIRKSVNKKVDGLRVNPFLGKRLGNKRGHDLSEFFKLYAYSKKYRIIYRLITPTQIEIIEIIGIGKRDKGEVYQTIINRLSDTSKD